MTADEAAAANASETADLVASRRIRNGLALALTALGALYLVWFRSDAHALLAYGFFALPPLLLALLVARGGRVARFWSGVSALLWFSHGVMIAWSEPAQRGYALAETALAVLVVFAASADGLRERARKRRAARGTAA